MKGIILAGGVGSRLRPVTHLLNKSLLPIYDKPAVYYSIELFKAGGISEVCVIAEHHYLEDFKTLLGNGTDFGVKIFYENDTPNKKGPAQAVYYAKDFADGSDIALIFSDNIFDLDIKKEVESFKSGARVFVKQVENPKRFGVVEFSESGKVLSIEEKPENPKSNFVMTGLQFYDNNVFKYIDEMSPAEDGEYYMTEINHRYLEKDALSAVVVNGFWQDMGTFDGLAECNMYWYSKAKKIAL